MAPYRNPHSQKIARVVACRVITIANVPGREVILSVGVPRRVGQAEWRCPILVEGLDDNPIADAASGIDSLQALLQAVECVRRHLKESGRRFAWLGESRLWGTGIPRQVPIDLGRRFEEQIERAIERESQKARKFRAPILGRFLAEAESGPTQVKQAARHSNSVLPTGKAKRRKRRR
jgi:hypothetical protein